MKLADKKKSIILLSIITFVILCLIGGDLYAQIVIHPRSAWNARSPDPTKLTNMTQPINDIIVHHSGEASHEGVAAIKSIQNHHMNTNGWGDIGYNYIITVDGKIYEGRSLVYMGAHCPGHNDGSIGICVLGNYDVENITNIQIQALQDLLLHLCGNYGLDEKNPNTFHYHQQFITINSIIPQIALGKI